MKRIRILAATLVLFLGLGGLVPATSLAATPAQTACSALTGKTSCATDSSTGPSVSKLITTIVSILSWVVGIASVIMIIVGGFRFITSGGDSNSVASARSTVLYAVIGLVIAAFAQIIVQFVLQKIQ